MDRVPSGVPQGSILGTLITGGRQSGVVSHILKFADDVKIFGKAVEVTDDRKGSRCNS